MKRDWDLVRLILVSLDEAPAGVDVDAGNVPGYQLPIVAYHMKIMAERGLIDGKPLSSAGTAHDFIAYSLTWEGQEFLDAIKNDTVWKKVKSYAKDKGADLTFDMIKTLATMYVKNLLGIGAG